VSEYEPGVEPAPWRFPARNRIIAGLCRATVVIEARERSGALITADFALEEGGDVLAVPGEITSALSSGANALLRLGATPVTCVDDVLEVYGVERRPPETAALGGPARALLAGLENRPLSADELFRTTSVDPAVGAGALIELELAGRVTHEDGVYRVAI
jgi:DNA processing protein